MIRPLELVCYWGGVNRLLKEAMAIQKTSKLIDGIIHGRTVLDVTHTQLHELFCHAL